MATRELGFAGLGRWERRVRAGEHEVEAQGIIWAASGRDGACDTGQEGRGQSVRPLGVLSEQLTPPKICGLEWPTSLLRPQDATKGMPISFSFCF